MFYVVNDNSQDLFFVLQPRQMCVYYSYVEIDVRFVVLVLDLFSRLVV